MNHSYLVTLIEGMWGEPRTVLVEDLKALVALLSLVEEDEETDITHIRTLGVHQDYSEFVKQLLKRQKPNDLNLG